MNAGLKIIGSQKQQNPKNGEVFWELEEWDNAFHFFVPDSEVEPLLIEYDELTAAGPAYKLRGPLYMLDIFQRLEELAPGFTGVRLESDARLIRRRLRHSPGISVEVGGKKLFLKEPTLQTINFIDFYHAELKTTPQLTAGEIHETISDN